jgi:hypothetical protein
MKLKTASVEIEVTLTSLFVSVRGVGEMFLKRGWTTFSPWSEVEAAQQAFTARHA